MILSGEHYFGAIMRGASTDARNEHRPQKGGWKPLPRDSRSLPFAWPG